MKEKENESKYEKGDDDIREKCNKFKGE